MHSAAPVKIIVGKKRRVLTHIWWRPPSPFIIPQFFFTQSFLLFLFWHAFSIAAPIYTFDHIHVSTWTGQFHHLCKPFKRFPNFLAGWTENKAAFSEFPFIFFYYSEAVLTRQQQSYILCCLAAGEKENPCRASTVWKRSQGPLHYWWGFI